MGLDIRVPIGLMFSVFGLILSIYGMASDRAIYAKSLGINVNMGWGVVLLAFGLIMLTAGIRGNRAHTETVSAADVDGPPRGRH